MKTQYIYLLLFSFFTLQLAGQGWRQTYNFPSNSYRVYSLAQHPDGGYLAATSASLTTSFNAAILKTTAVGDSVWLKSYPGGYGIFIAENTDGTFSFVTDEYVNVIDTEGEVISTAAIPETDNFDFQFTANQAVDSAGNGDLLLGGHNNTGHAMITRLTPAGQEIWTRTFPHPNEEEVHALAEDEAGNIYLGLQSTPPGEQFSTRIVLKIDPEGNTLWRTELPNDGNASDTPDGIVVMNGTEGIIIVGSGVPQISRLSTDGDLLWSDALSSSYSPSSIVEDQEGNFTITGVQVSNGIYRNDIFLLNLDENGNHNWEHTYTRLEFEGGDAILPTADAGFLIGGNTVSQGFSSGSMLLMKTDALGNLFTNQVSGQVFLDLNNNCQKDPNEPLLPNTGLTLTKPGFESIAITDTAGQFTMQADTGAITLTPYFNSPYYTTECSTDVPLFTGFFDTLSIDVPATPVVYCSLLQVNLSTPFLRRCFSNTYTVDYCNIGTASAGNVHVEITLDPFLELQEASIPFEELSPGRYKFDVENLDIGQCGRFNMTVLVSCEAELGQSHCTEAHIFPDELCLPPVPGYSGAFLELEALCLDTTAFFRIQNTGDGDMAAPLEYIVIEDAVLLQQETYNLAQGQQTLLNFPANGSTYYFNTPQEPGAPGADFLSVVLEGCGTNADGSFSTGFVNIFPQSDSDPWLDIDCRENIGSFDPNDIQVFPKGYGAEGQVEPGTTLEYLIRFQNTGTDTAFTVEILNPFPPELNLSTLQPLGSSHDYKLTVLEDKLLSFRFDNILLPDSTTNLEASQGYVRYRAEHREELPLGTTIENDAAIYFDFNEPIFTNTALTTIDENFILVNMEEIYVPGLSLNAYPNPFTDFLNISFDGLSGNTVQILIYNTEGKLVRQLEQPFAPVVTLRPGAMPNGQYALQVWVDQKLTAAGTIINH